MPQLAFNKRAHYDYEILDKFEAGLSLLGHEVKSVREGRLSLIGSHVTLSRGDAWLMGAQIAPYPKAGKLPDYDSRRSRKLLLHKRELNRLAGKLEQKGLTLVPISAYTKGSLIKLEFGLARGKKEYEKRDKIKQRDIERDLKRGGR